MKVECKNRTCGHSFEVPDGANLAAVNCPRCGNSVGAAAPPSAAVPPPLPARPGPTGSLAAKPAPVAEPASKPVTPNRLDLPPYLAISSITDPKLAEIPPVERFQKLHPGEQVVKSYQIRIRNPKISLVAIVVMVIPAMLAIAMSFIAERDREASSVFWWIGIFFLFLIVAIVAGFYLFRMRGHTFLYLTNLRVIVLELFEGAFGREQAVCHFGLDDICGFQLYAQRGLKKLFGLLLLKEKRTFYLGITTRTCHNVEIGAVNSRRSQFDPGRDAVALCGELDAKVLALNAAHGRPL